MNRPAQQRSSQHREWRTPTRKEDSMKCLLCPVALVALSALALGSLVALTQPDATTHKSTGQPGRDQPGKPGGTPDKPLTGMSNEAGMQDGMDAWMASMKPGPNHERLGKLIGKWDTTLTFRMPGEPAQESKGKAEYSWLMEGRWLQQTSEGSM